MKKNYVNCKMMALLLTVTVVSSILSGCGNDAGNVSTEERPEESSDTSSVTYDKLPATGDVLTKDETVYVLCNAQGEVSKVIVSDWVKNGTQESSIADFSELSDIKVVKGDTAYSLDQNQMTVWDAKGGDVHYQGTSGRDLPVTVAVSYALDGKAISAEELAGKSGKVTIRFDYTNTQYEMVEIDGEQTKIYVPFVMMTGLMLDNEKFSNVEVSNGKRIDGSADTIVIGFALPGMQESLGIDSEDLDIPDYVEITADVTDFSMETTFTLAANEMFRELDGEDLNGLDGYSGSVSELTDAMDQLMNGSSQLYDGLETLLEKSEALIDGINQIAEASAKLSAGASGVYDGTISLRDNLNSLQSGLGTLVSNNDTLNQGAQTVFESLLAAANSQIAGAGLEQIGISVPTLTMSNYNAALEQLIRSLDAGAVYDTAYNAALAAVTAQVEASTEAITAAVTEAVREQVTQQVMANEAAVYEAAVYTVLVQNLMAQGMTEEQAAAYLQTAEGQALIAGAIASLTEEQKAAAIEAAVAQQMAGNEVQALIASNVEQQKKTLIESHMAGSEVTGQIAAAVESANAGAAALVQLKGQLTQYSLFYDGLKSYTAGVSEAYEGSRQLTAGADTLEGYVKQLSDGLGALDDAMSQLQTGAALLPDGVSQLKDGAMQLSDGLKQLNEEGIQKIADLLEGDLTQIMTRLEAVLEVSKDYNNYSGIRDGMDGSVKFIYRTDSIQTKEGE